jgi:hypothetical protein
MLQGKLYLGQCKIIDCGNGKRPVVLVKPPAEARSASTFETQLGERPCNAKPLKGFSRVLGIRDNFDGDT